MKLPPYKTRKEVKCDCEKPCNCISKANHAIFKERETLLRELFL